MNVQNIFRATDSWSWVADADPIGAPQGALLRSDNLVPEELGAVALRKGSIPIYTGLAQQRAHSLRTVYLGTSAIKYRLAGIDDTLYLNGNPLFGPFTGTSGADFAFGDDAYQAFIARGTTKKKFDGTSQALNNWGIAAPSLAATVTATTAVFATVATLASGESPAPTYPEGTATFVNDVNNTAQAATQITPDPVTGRGSISKKFSSDQNFFNISGGDGGDTDLFDLFVYLAEPRKLENVTIMFGLGTGTDPFAQDYYAFDFDFTANPIKDAAALATTVATKLANKVPTTGLTPETLTYVKSIDDAIKNLKLLGAYTGPTSRPRRDAQQASPAWTHFSVMRGQFQRVGGTAGRDWTTVRGFKIVFQEIPGSTEVASFASAIIQGGGARSLTGNFTITYRFVRDTGAYLEMSPMAPPSTPIQLTQQALTVTIPAASISGADPQVNQIWIYMQGDFLDTFYRIAVTGSTASNSSMRIDEFAKTAHGTIDATDRTRLLNQGLSIPGQVSSNDLVVNILKSEIDALVENEIFEPGATGPPDNIVSIAGPYLGRIFAITQDGWLYPSSNTSPSNFSLYHVLDLRKWGTPLWMTMTSAGIIVGMTKDIIRIDGTGDESTDGTAIDLYPTKIGVGNPPVDACMFTDQNAVIYRGSDDLMTMTGIGTTPVDQGTVSLLWRGWARHGVSQLNLLTGRFRITVSTHILFLLAAEGTNTDGNTTIWRYDRGKWSRTIYPVSFLSLHREQDGTVLAGTTNGQIWQLENGFQDNQSNVPVYFYTPFSDGGNPLVRKDPFDLQLQLESDGTLGTVSVYVDGIEAPAAAFPFSIAGRGIFRANLQNIVPRFTFAAIVIQGSFSVFRLKNFNLSYRALPQQVMSIDTGWIVPEEPHEMVWLTEVELDCISPANIVMTPYLDDIVQNPVTITVKPNQRSTYRIRPQRGVGSSLKARRVKLAFATTNANGVGSVGFEPFFIRVHHRPSGDDAPEKPWQTVYPVTQTEFFSKP
jgi:hypothetical protein